ncbi:hypothetical protein ACFC5X_07025 [Streptomyces sp. NPDC055952]|uniref:hypothetical protein n=1 Tax=Streptomyces sp. NPDC055952 TaxID=3345663 RepID=UPI0035D78B09
MRRHARGLARDPRKARLIALVGTLVACAVALPLAVAASGAVRPERPARPAGTGSSAAAGDRRADPGAGGGPARTAAPGRDLASAVRCGPELASPDGIEAQTCLVARGADTWARTYYRNTTGAALDAVLSLMGPADRTVCITCAVAAGDEPGTCETPRERARGDLAAYTAVTEFARRGGQGPLLLRSGSNSPVWTSS